MGNKAEQLRAWVMELHDEPVGFELTVWVDGR